MFCGWKGNRRSGVAMPCVTDNSGTPTEWLTTFEWMGDEDPSYVPLNLTFSTVSRSRLQERHVYNEIDENPMITV